jgi:adenylate kinase family enzyme
MKKVAVFGNAAGGKSTPARKLTEATGLPLCSIDTSQFRPSGPVPREEYLAAHAGMKKQDSWIVDGFGCVETAWERFACADTLVYVDLPLATHRWWVTKRLVQGLFTTPEG